ncbi:hypothetical protein DBR06_SOUSAS5610021, partial [Sousa chinensis]
EARTEWLQTDCKMYDERIKRMNSNHSFSPWEIDQLMADLSCWLTSAALADLWTFQTYTKDWNMGNIY